MVTGVNIRLIFHIFWRLSDKQIRRKLTLHETCLCLGVNTLRSGDTDISSLYQCWIVSPFHRRWSTTTYLSWKIPFWSVSGRTQSVHMTFTTQGLEFEGQETMSTPGARHVYHHWLVSSDTEYVWYSFTELLVWLYSVNLDWSSSYFTKIIHT